MFFFQSDDPELCIQTVDFHTGVSKNRGTPKWMVYSGKPYKHGWFGRKTHHFRKHPYISIIRLTTLAPPRLRLRLYLVPRRMLKFRHPKPRHVSWSNSKRKRRRAKNGWSMDGVLWIFWGGGVVTNGVDFHHQNMTNRWSQNVVNVRETHFEYGLKFRVELLYYIVWVGFFVGISPGFCWVS